MCVHFYIIRSKWLPNSLNKTNLGTASFEHLERLGTAQTGWNLAEAINKFHTFSAARGFLSMQRISFDLSIKLLQGFGFQSRHSSVSLLTILYKVSYLSQESEADKTMNKTLLCDCLTKLSKQLAFFVFSLKAYIRLCMM